MISPHGIVHLVGAGPGDPGLITVSGLNALRRAQVVVFDRLIDRALLDEAPDSAERIDVGKRPGDAPVSQDEINEMLVSRARSGFRVVRLKGGDPFIFGRGFEELTACRDAGIDCIVIPGVSSAIAAPEVAGIPLTLRGVSRSFAVLTAETAPDTANAIDFSQVRGIDTLVILMARSKLGSIARTLIASGWSADMPVSCIEQATTPRQKNISGTLATIASIAEQMELSAPMVTIVGQVARHCRPAQITIDGDEQLSPSPCQAEGAQGGSPKGWGESETRSPSPLKGGGRGEGKNAQTESNRPTTVWTVPTSLAGKRILITRPRLAALKLAAKLDHLGAVPIVCPLIRIIIPRENPTLDAAIKNLSAYKWLAFTSAHGVKAFWRRLVTCGFDARRLSGCKLAALGSATARQLRKYGLHADLTARSASDLASKIIAKSKAGPHHILWPRGNRALSLFCDRLHKAGFSVDDPVAYQSLPSKPAPEVQNQIRRGVEAILLYSPSAARQLASLDLSLNTAIIVCIGPTTADAANGAGLRVDAVAAEPSDDGVLAELERCFQTRVKV